MNNCLVNLTDENKIHEKLCKNKNSRIEIWYNNDTEIIVHYKGIKEYALFAYPNNTYLVEGYTQEVKAVIGRRKPDQVIKGREQCREYQNFMAVMVKILPDNASIFVGKIA